MRDCPYYVLDDDGRPLPVDDLRAWGHWMEHNRARCRVAYNEWSGVRVSTVFLGLDHSFFGDGPPILWETMIFGGPHDMDQWRYTSHEEAIEGHAAALALARGAVSEGP